MMIPIRCSPKGTQYRSVNCTSQTSRRKRTCNGLIYQTALGCKALRNSTVSLGQRMDMLTVEPGEDRNKTCKNWYQQTFDIV